MMFYSYRLRLPSTLSAKKGRFYQNELLSHVEMNKNDAKKRRRVEQKRMLIDVSIDHFFLRSSNS